MLSLLLLFTLHSFAQVEDSDALITSMGTPQLLEKLKSEGLCHTSKAARMCRALPWLPTKDEGAIEVNGNVYIFLKASSLKQASPMREWVEKFPESKVHEYVSYVLAMRRSVADTMNSNSIGGLYILILDGEGDQLKPKSVFLATSQSIGDHAYEHEESVRSELNKSIREWIPPENYDSTFQFKLIQ